MGNPENKLLSVEPDEIEKEVEEQLRRYGPEERQREVFGGIQGLEKIKSSLIRFYLLVHAARNEVQQLEESGTLTSYQKQQIERVPGPLGRMIRTGREHDEVLRRIVQSAWKN